MELSELKEMVDMNEVLDRYSIPYKKKGKYFFLRCLSPTHDDKHPSSFFTNKNIHCPACGCNYSVLDVIMQYEDCDIKEAICILWELAGRPEEFTLPGTKQTNTENKRYYPPKKLLSILDITLPKKTFIPYGETIENSVEGYNMGKLVNIDDDGNFHYLYGKMADNFYSEYEEFEIKEMLHGKINEKLNEIIKKRNTLGIKYIDESVVDTIKYLLTEKEKLEKERY